MGQEEGDRDEGERRRHETDTETDRDGEIETGRCRDGQLRRHVDVLIDCNVGSVNCEIDSLEREVSYLSFLVEKSIDSRQTGTPGGSISPLPVCQNIGKITASI